MIQRIQSLWLLASAVCAGLTFKYPFYSGNKPDDANQQFLVASSDFFLVIFTTALVATCFFIIFLYKNRKQQLWYTIAATFLSVVNLVIYFMQLKKFSSGTFSLTAVFAFAIPVFLILAVRGIWKDEKLVKSLDRLR